MTTEGWTNVGMRGVQYAAAVLAGKRVCQTDLGLLVPKHLSKRHGQEEFDSEM